MKIKIAQCNSSGLRMHARLVLNFQIFTMNIQCICSIISLSFGVCSSLHRLIDFHCCYQHDVIFLRFHPQNGFGCWHRSRSPRAHKLQHVDRCISPCTHSIEKLSLKKTSIASSYFISLEISSQKKTHITTMELHLGNVNIYFLQYLLTQFMLSPKTIYQFVCYIDIVTSYPNKTCNPRSTRFISIKNLRLFKYKFQWKYAGFILALEVEINSRELFLELIKE